MVLDLFYLCSVGLMIGGGIYLLIKVSDISRNVAWLADSVAVLARNSAAPTAVPPVAPEPWSP
jgi:hypothetical protein